MGFLVTGGATLQCSCGTSTASLIVIPESMVSVDDYVATIMDYTPLVNIPSFSMCMSTSNPTVASATSAAGGVLTPQACIPVTTSSWVAGQPTVIIGSYTALTDSSTLTCSYGGVISISSAGQTVVEL